MNVIVRCARVGDPRAKRIDAAVVKACAKCGADIWRTPSNEGAARVVLLCLECYDAPDLGAFLEGIP